MDFVPMCGEFDGTIVAYIYIIKHIDGTRSMSTVLAMEGKT